MLSDNMTIMTSRNPLYNREEGYVLFFTLLLLVIMAVAGATMIGNTIVESSIVRNASQRSINFYAAESAAMEAGQRLEDEDDPVHLAAFNELWLNDNTAAADEKFAALNTDWDLDADSGGPYADLGMMDNTAFTTVRAGVAKSAELGMENESLMYEYTILGRTYEPNDEVVLAMVECGFLKRH